MKSSKMARVLSLLLAVMMIVGMMPVTAMAAEEAAADALLGSDMIPLPEIVEEPEVTETPEVTEAPEVTEDPEVTETPEVTEDPEATEAPEVTEDPEATEAPEATEDPEATETPEASEEPEEEAAEEAEVAMDGNVVYENGKFGYNGYYNVISRKDYVLVPGAAYEYEMVLNNAAGTRRQVIHVIEVDPSNPDVSIVPGYNQIDKDLTNEANWSHKELTEMAKYYENNLGYNIVGGMNTDLYYDTYAPRILVYNGEDLSVKGKTSPSSSILYVFRDAEGKVSCEVKAFNRTEFDGYLADGTLLHAVSVSFGMVVKDGELVKAEERTSAAAARSMVGVKADGTLVICMNDGRGANNSVGFCDFEEGEAMLALGCQWAANCDGGGSSTFLTKRVGEETFTMRSVPCDGAQRPTAHGIFVTSNVAPTGELDEVNVESDYDIFAPNTVYTFGAAAIDTHGYAMEMPADASWALSDASFGTIENGEFTSNGTMGKVDIQVLSGGEVVGSKTITVADPEVFTLSATSTVVPYSTPDKVRTITLPIVAMTGEANVYVDANVVSVVLSNKNAGTLDGFNFTATDDTSIESVEVTITYGETVLTYAIEFGKGSEIVFDFEDGDISDWMGFDEAKQWNIENGVENTLTGSSPIGGQFSENVDGYSFLATRENGGQVRNGNYALGFKLDNTDADFAEWTYNIIYYVGGPMVLRDVANGQKATSFGAWVYIPEGAAGLAMQLTVYKGTSKETATTGTQLHFYFTSAATGNETNLNSATEADIPESRWVYASVDLTDNYVSLVDPAKNQYREPTFIRTYIKPTAPMVHTFYFDDFTLDYSSAVDDRVLPTITAPTYSTSDTAVSLENGASISGTNFAFSATVADNAALDLTSGKITVDGVAVKAGIAGGALSSQEDIALAPGAHTVVFEVEDELGNPAKLTRAFTVSGDAAVTLSGHNDSGEVAKAQSVYYVDINVADLASVNKLVATLKLNNANTWETEGAVVANGFEASFDYNEVSELLTVTVELADAAKTRSADQTLVSIPVRVWTFDRYDHVTGEYVAVASMGNKPAVDIECEVVYGVIDGKSFGGSIDVATELTTISSPYHVHDAELTVLNQEPTATMEGYENRTYCETCQSVIDWGTILEATGHNYAIVDAKFVCQDEGCGHVLETGTGVYEMDGDLYYSVNNELKTGWQDMGTYEGDDYINGGAPFTMYGYAGSDYKLYVNGEHTVNGITYKFAEDGTTMGAFTTNSTGTRYSVGPSFIKRSWVTLAGDQYYFGEDTYMYTGTRSIPKNRNNPDEGTFWYLFAEDGKFIREYTDLNGIVEENGNLYWVVNGQNAYGGLMHLDTDGDGEKDAYYYARTYGQLVVDRQYWITKSNDLLPVANYTFGADGKMVNPPIVDPDPEPTDPPVVDPEPTDPPDVKNGIVEENGKLYYYVDGVKTYGGLMYLDSDGDGEKDAYYYARTSGEVVTGRTYWITRTNDLLPAANYTFGADGKMVNPPVENPDPDPDPTEPPVEDPEPTEPPAVKNGILEENGKLYYYVDGVKTYGGLMYLDSDGDGEKDAYYYARTSGEVVTGRTYWITKTNDLLPAANYTFGADGKMVNPPVVNPDPDPDPTDPPVVDPEPTEKPEVKNGICDDGSGTLYYYVDGVKTYGGLMYLDSDGDGEADAYYYARTSGQIVVSRQYWITKTNDLLPAANYTFDAEGKMVNPPVA